MRIVVTGLLGQYAFGGVTWDYIQYLLGFRGLGTIRTLRILRQMFTERAEPPRGRSVVAGHDLPAIQLSSSRPVAFQLDGEYMGEVEEVLFRSVPRALRVIG